MVANVSVSMGMGLKKVAVIHGHGAQNGCSDPWAWGSKMVHDNNSDPMGIGLKFSRTVVLTAPKV
jgi:hypothetical protein